MKNLKKPKTYKKIYNINNFKNKNIKKTIEKRYNILTILIFVIMFILTINLFNVQIIKNNYFISKVEQLNKTLITSSSTPRGRIYDRYGNIIVDNEAIKVIYYEKQKGVTIKEEIDISYKVASLIDVDYNKLTDYNLRKFFVLNNKELSDSKITDEEWKLLEERKITSANIESLKIERVTKKELDSMSTLDKEASYIYYLMNIGYSYDEKIIKKENVSDLEYATIASNISIIPGFNVRLDWNRYYPYGEVFRTILGSVSTKETGIPYELKDYYLNLGYDLDDRVGISYLEYQYESILKGNKTIYQQNKDGSINIIEEGSRGNDIVLTIDIKLQQSVEKILEEELLKAKEEPNTKYFDHAFVIISDPSTGEILAMAGKQIAYKNKKYVFYDYTPGIITTSVTAGSIVKGASNTVGYMNNALYIGEKRSDECIKIASTPLKCSWTKLGTLNDVTALKYSSNVFQFKTAIKVGGGSYKYNYPLEINPVAFDIYRKTFNEYGLGVFTGIDLPNENLGYNGTSTQAGHLLDFSIGQYDTYTPIQLSQYINTIANGGYRLKPYLLKAVYSPTKDGLTNLLYENKPTILNKVNILDEYMERIKEGFRQVMSVGGTGSAYMNSKYKGAGKTGTSESFIDSDLDGIIDKETMSNTFGGYAPFDDPKVSFLVISPNVYYHDTSTTRSAVNRRISYRISQKYFELYK